MAALCLALISAAAFLSPAVAEVLDTSALPRVAGAKALYASPLSTIYAAPAPVAQAAAAVGKALAGDGWRQYAAANADEAKTDDVQVMNFKKGPLALSVLVTKSDPATTANVNYTAKPLANDLPFPPDATDIAFDPHEPVLTCASSQPIPATLAFFNGELARMGWAPAPAGRNPNTDKGAHVYFVRPDHAPLLLVVQRGDDGATKIELKGVAAEDLAADLAPAKPAAAASAAAAPAPTPTPDEVSAAVAKQAQQAIADIAKSAMADATAPKAAAPLAPSGPVETLAAMEGNNATIPVPATAEAVKFDGAEGKLAFETESSIESVVAFYRAAMKPLGWQAESSGIDKPNMVVLDFSKDGKDIELTLMHPIDKTEVDASGEGLVNEAEKEAAAPAPTAEDLAVEETGGFPVPSNHTLAEAEGTPLRHALTVETPLDLKSVLGFYRQELGKRGWKEEATGATVADDRATLAFTSPDGPAVLKLERKDDATTVSLVVSNQAKAAQSGLLAKPGKVKAMFGNLLSAPVTFTINKQTVKVAPGVGANGPGGPTLELPPGKYKVSMKAGPLEVSDDVEVGAGEIWGFMAGPGGLMPMQIH
ncbi:MAG: hypothetical protein ABSF49_21130 [Roseiarcus sp.]|uniref:hypothetical protein n=1 Tax=Roseiarcus sp. TaxID=1969460 RepID=UPI003C1E8F72